LLGGTGVGELLLLFKVLQGEMSIFGARPYFSRQHGSLPLRTQKNTDWEQKGGPLELLLAILFLGESYGEH
jgi:lipopolysaccharide/colanic/teichoic acid biosynthesis glycosyltransferase